MSDAIRLHTPFTRQMLESLHAGDSVLISGTIYTARDAAHKRLVQLLEEGGKLPFDLKGQVIYYVGPAPAPPGKVLGSAGPTTSYRMDPYAPALMAAGLRGMIGKGPRNRKVVDAMMEFGAVYFAAVGGAGVIAAETVKSARIVAYEDLGTEAVRELEVEDFPCIVANDLHGGDIYEIGVKAYRVD